jgi:hypothetical protein
LEDRFGLSARGCLGAGKTKVFNPFNDDRVVLWANDQFAMLA